MKRRDPLDFQSTVSECLIRHRSILDCLSKFQESAARVNRAIVKAVTACGCLEVRAKRQTIPADISLAQARDYVDTHLAGSLCPDCKDTIETELGMSLFYLTAICNTLDLDLEEILDKEKQRISALGVYSLL
ncbi:MAG TPA: DUF1573 domain-containing protein [Firmicutes bacterium]|nr:DUF1573 domain-containing protein [Bacillota bacterium]